MAKMQRTPKGPFQDMCHNLRVQGRLKLRQVADAIGIAPSSAGNVEYSRFRVISDEKAARLADFYKLGPKTYPTRDAFMAASAALPISEYTANQRERWKVGNEQRSKSRRYELLFEAVNNLVCMHAAFGDPCTCTPAVAESFDEPAVAGVTCALCQACQAMGIPEGYGDSRVVLDRIGKLYAARDAKAAAKAAAP